MLETLVVPFTRNNHLKVTRPTPEIRTATTTTTSGSRPSSRPATAASATSASSPGRVEIELPYDTSLTQQDGFIHAGVSSIIMDSACGYAAFSLMPADARVLTIEFKINLLAPAAGERFRAVGQVRKSGRSVFVAESDLFAEANGDSKAVASMTGTLMAVYPRA